MVQKELGAARLNFNNAQSLILSKYIHICLIIRYVWERPWHG